MRAVGGGGRVVTMLTRRASRWVTAAVFAGLGFGASAGVQAQESRAEAIAQRQAEKAARLESESPGRIERLMLYLEERGSFDRLKIRADGFYPRIGGLPSGSGFAIGAGYRHHFGRDWLLDGSAAVSRNRYTLAQVELERSLAGGLFTLKGQARHRENTQEDYFGLGGQARLEDQTSYLYRGTELGAELAANPGGGVSVGIRMRFLRPHVGGGRDPLFPSTDELFSEAEAPGLDAQPDFLHGSLFFDLNSYDRPGNPRSGGRHHVGMHFYSDRDLDRYSFRQIETETTQLIPFFDKRRVIALRAFLTMSSTEDDRVVPFYLMPRIGGAYTLRAFEEYRFHDRHAMLFNAEYRWEVFAALDMALFADAGKVFADRRHLDFRNLEGSYGVGFRVSTRNNFILRFDIGTGGGEGTHVIFKFGPVLQGRPGESPSQDPSR